MSTGISNLTIFLERKGKGLIPLSISSVATIRELMTVIEKQTGISADRFSISFGGSPLLKNENVTLQSCGIKNQTKITMIEEGAVNFSITVMLSPISFCDFEVAPITSVKRLQERIDAKLDVLPQNQELTINGTVITDYKMTMRELGVEGGMVIMLRDKSMESAINVDYLLQFFPERNYGIKKLSMCDVLPVNSKYSSKKGIKMVQELLNCNYMAAFQLAGDPSQTEVSHTSQDVNVHPLDLLLMVLYLSDDFLRQNLMTKLASCQVALPVILPPVHSFPYKNDSFEMLLWSLRSLSNPMNCKEPLTEIMSPAILFVRYGNTKKISKSHFASTFIHDDKLPRFCSRKSHPLIRKWISNGLVDAAWHHSEDGDGSRSNWVALNLHGSLNKTTLNIVDFVCELKHLVLCVFIGELNDSDEECECILSHLMQLSANVNKTVWIKTNDLGYTKLKEFVKIKRPETYFSSQKTILIESAQNDESSLTEKLRTVITQELRKAGTHDFSLENLSKLATTSNKLILIDEEKPELKAVKQLAEAVYLSIDSNDKSRSHYLPMQENMIRVIALEKSYRQIENLEVGDNIGDYQAKIDAELVMEKQKLSQLAAEILQVKRKPFTEFFEAIRSTSRKSSLLLFFIELDRRFNDSTLSPLCTEICELEQKICKSEEIGADKSLLSHLETELKNKFNELEKREWKVEYFLRECFILSETTNDENFRRELLNVSLYMLENGLSIEIMDGHSGNVPIMWLKHLFDVLKDCKVCVISVIGLQSSGKSTMLNSMFGLNLKSTAGRTTRGIFAQLLALDLDVCRNLNCTHILLLDTQGLHSAASLQNNQLDNELAMIVISLSDIAIINVKGENMCDLIGILQFGLIGIIRQRRMQQNSQIKFEPEVFLVHQNVESMEAYNQTGKDRSAVREALNQAARLAAESEGLSNIEFFSQIINLNISDPRRVHFMPNLFHGIRPLAAINPDYTEKISHLKSEIFHSLENKKDSFLHMNFAWLKLNDIWESILQNSFIFSFRSALDLLARQFVESRYCDWRRTMIIAAESFVTSAAMEFDPKANNLDIVLQQFSNSLNQKYIEILQFRFSVAFQDERFGSLLKHLRPQFETKFKTLHESLETRCHKKLMALEKAISSFKNDVYSYEKEIRERVKDLSEQYRDKNLNGDDRHQMFESIWSDWMRKISDAFYQHSTPTDSIKELFDLSVAKFFHRGSLIYTEYSMVLSGNYKSKKLRKWFWKHVEMAQLFLMDGKTVEECLGDIIDVVDHLLVRYKQKGGRVELADIEEVIRYVLQFESRFSDYPNLYAQILFKIRERSCKVFEEIQYEYFSQYDLLVKISEQKELFFLLFEGLLLNQPAIQLTATMLASCVNKCITSYLKIDSNKLFLLFLEKTIPKTRSDLTAICLYSIGSLIQKLPEKYLQLVMDYVKTPKLVLEDTLIAFVQDVYKNRNCEVSNYFDCLIAGYFDEIVRCIDQIDESSDESQIEISKWLQKVLETFHIKSWGPVSQEIKTKLINEVESISASMAACVDLIQLKETCKQYVLQKKGSIHFEITRQHADKAASFLCSSELMNICQELCPFCKVICEREKDHAEDHWVSQHRPVGLAGGHYDISNEISCDICNSLVLTKGRTFYVTQKTNKFFGFFFSSGKKACECSDYRKYFKDWEIRGNASINTNVFWMWLLANYNEQIASALGKKKAAVPDHWMRITWRNAVESLESGNDLQLWNSDPLQI